MQTKRILVIEESEVVRETLAIILGREFVVAKRPFGKGAFSFAETDRGAASLVHRFAATGTHPARKTTGRAQRRQYDSRLYGHRKELLKMEFLIA
jgi:hypothetical protein